MKKYIRIIQAMMLVLLISACDNEDPQLSAQELLQEELESTWTLPEQNGIVVDGEDLTLNYTGLTLTVGDLTYSTSNGGDLFRSSGTWAWADAETTSLIILDDGKELNFVSLTDNEVVFTFFNADGGTRAGIEGNYRVTLVR